MNFPVDQRARDEALNISNSYIVQAPAGSGKTELLTCRYLALLANAVQNPQEVVAITFTKKAASEMRDRVLSALRLAQTGVEPEQVYAKKTYKLARAVLDANARHGWNILCNSHQLRITTIDALCASIVKQMPILAKLGAAKVTDDASELYKQAVSALLADLNDNVSYSAAISKLLLYLDNRVDHFERLLIGMLQKREQWLDIIIGAKHNSNLRSKLESSLQGVVDYYYDQFCKTCPFELFAKQLPKFKSLETDGLTSKQRVLYLIDHLFAPIFLAEDNCSDKLTKFLAILLKSDGAWRQKLDKRQGFFAPSFAKNEQEAGYFKARKDKAIAFLQDLQQHENFREVLVNLQNLPAEEYPSKQWSIVEALLEVLPILVAHLKIIFANKAKVDFNEIALCALEALGAEDEPTELALTLDYQIKHLLIDEFQDVSQLQYRLFKALTCNWGQDEARTVFAVGDPMQSIYRFRQADVSLFARTKMYGLGQLQFKFLQLSANFRSSPQIIDWLNNNFLRIFPAQYDELTGATPYAHADCGGGFAKCDSHVTLLNDNELTVPYKQTVAVIRKLLQEQPKDNIAVLIRSRSHLKSILPILQKANITYSATDIESLANRLVIRDLLSLTYAINHAADEISWLALLRSPFVGLDLSDLHRLMQMRQERMVFEVMVDEKYIATLTLAKQKAINHFNAVMATAVDKFDRISLRDIVEKTWIELGGETYLATASDLDNVNLYFELLSKLEADDVVDDRVILQENVEKLRAKTFVDNPDVYIMTIHKAKGLEFDTVIIPACNKISRGDDQPLLLWQEHMGVQGHELLLAPIKPVGGTADSIYKFLYQNEKKRADYEARRLFYVAATRAKKRLYLVFNKDEEVKATKGSFLEMVYKRSQFPGARSQVDE